MKLYRNIILIAMLSQPFFCLSMHKNSPTIEQEECPLHEILDYCLKKTNPYQFRKPRLKLSESNFKAIQNLCIVDQPLSSIQTTVTTTVNHASPEPVAIALIQSQNTELLLAQQKEKELLEIKASLEKQFVELKKQNDATLTIVKQKEKMVEKLSKEITSVDQSFRNHWFTVKYLMRKYDVPNRYNLVLALKQHCDRIFCGTIHNNETDGPYFNSIIHVLLLPVNRYWSCTFSPCTGTLVTVYKPYSVLLTDYTSSLEEFSLCTPTLCQSYKCKNATQ